MGTGAVAPGRPGQRTAPHLAAGPGDQEFGAGPDELAARGGQGEERAVRLEPVPAAEEAGYVDAAGHQDVRAAGQDGLGQLAAPNGGHDGGHGGGEGLVAGPGDDLHRTGHPGRGRPAGGALVQAPAHGGGVVGAGQRGRVVPGHGDPLAAVGLPAVEHPGDDQPAGVLRGEGEGAEGDHRVAAGLAGQVVDAGQSGQLGHDGVGRPCGPGSGGQHRRAGGAQTDQDPVLGHEHGTGAPGQGVGIEVRARGQGEADGSGHGRPLRVAVRSWLSPPERVRRLTEEKPASTRSRRSSPAEGR